MKRIAILVCVLVLVAANTAEARWRNRSNNTNYANTTYTRPVAGTPVTVLRPVTPAASDAEVTTADAASETDSTSTVATASHSATATTARSTSLSTATAQGVANIMASRNQVGHWGGNPGYEGCGCGATPAAAYSICCYGNSGMATVDVGYAQAANGMWFCCRRYR